MRRLAWLLVIARCVLAAHALEPGQPAPSLEGITGWLNGAAADPAKPDGKTVYVIEFSATWCPPCRETVPHLNKIYQAHKDRGLVVIGVTYEEPDKVRAFASELGMNYRVALDTEKVTEETYMADVEGIPHAFVVDRQGKIVWSGHPLAQLEQVVAGVLDGRYDPEQARRLREKQEAMLQAYEEGKLDRAMALLDELIAADPLDMEQQQMKAGLLVQSGQMEALREHFAAMLKVFDASPQDLNAIAWMIASNSPLPEAFRDVDAAYRAARKAAELTGRKDPAVLDTLALVYYRLGLLDEAIQVEAQAVALEADGGNADEYKDMLKHYQTIAEARERARVERAADTD